MGDGMRRGSSQVAVGRSTFARTFAILVAVLVLSLSGAEVVGAAGASDDKPFAGVKPAKRATLKKPPPSRPCVGDCVVPSKYRSYEGFLLWAGDDARAMWSDVFRQAGRRFKPTVQLTLSGSATSRTRCSVQPRVVGTSHRSGPFYCWIDGPADADGPAGTIFIPANTTKALVFNFARDYPTRAYRERDFALSLIVAHEWAHHVQQQWNGALGKKPPIPSVQLELQADCYAGVWAYSAWARSLLEKGDIQEGLSLIEAIGDLPGSERTHGTGKQRMEWFMRGYTTGRPDRCDTTSVRA